MDSGEEEEEEPGWAVMETGVVGGAVEDSQRVILHFDLDCFYAQVEMIRNPALRSKPLGVQQKYIIVTCNYVARERGVTKLMGVKEALEKCPDLVLVKGEDLTHYRDISYKVTELLMSFCPLVERLGFDENFVDVSEMVETRMKDTSISDLSFVGHVYGHEASSVGVGDHSRLAVGSAIAAELREALRSRLGLTSCAGVATSKLLAKLVSGAFKPNQQTTLLPQSSAELMNSLSGPCKVPGIGYRTVEKLKVLGVVSVRDLQLFPLRDLIREFGEVNGRRIQNLACGVDLSPVTPAGPPQSLSDEDSFKKISTVREVQSKVTELLNSLCERMCKDGRLPQTVRLTLRRASAPSRWFSRESRQCPIPKHTAQKIITGCGEAVPQLLSIVMKLFHKLVNAGDPFHLTLLNVCFSNLQTKNSGRNAISSFFTHTTTSAAHTHVQETGTELGVCEESSSITQANPACGTQNTESTKELLKCQTSTASSSASSASPSSASSSFFQNALLQSIRSKPSTSPRQPVSKHSGPKTTSSGRSSTLETQKSPKLPPHVDPDVFQALPEHIQKELMASFQTGDALPEDSIENPSPVAAPARAERPEQQTQAHINQKQTSQLSQISLNQSHQIEHSNINVAQSQNHNLCDSSSTESAISLPDVPPNVDPLVFSQLPSDMQNELLAEWKQRKPTLKISSTKPATKQSASRDHRPAARASQNNSLLKYFKPN
ncbi:DNA polymerase iota [Astyanax mexicanus]|uniref:DNA polymerase iota n=1 Tax=Astyanax mexicanus TaxID=7994 RepID=UPI0020CB2578|nr:DNA polymerase iota [Astyanax mexicanus]XP_022531455.2 DNA polymerase iota [Astyanax mexicanus]